MGACVKCAAGSFQANSGELECEPCTPGSYCAEGAAAALPCKEGSYQNATMLQLNLLMTSADDCVPCPAGSSCGTGAAAYGGGMTTACGWCGCGQPTGGISGGGRRRSVASGWGGLVGERPSSARRERGSGRCVQRVRSS